MRWSRSSAAGEPASDRHPDLESLSDTLLACGGQMAAAHAAAKAIFLATPSPHPNRRMTSERRVSEVLERPWRWMADSAESGTAVLAAKLALVCWLWNRALIPDDPMIQAGALVEVPPEAEVRLYVSGLRALTQLPRQHRLGGDWRGEFLVADTLPRVASGLVRLYDKGVSVPPDAYRTAVSLAG
jgi:hypothetical protein